MSSINGYKTYVLGVLGIVYAVAGFATGHMDANTALGIVWASLTAMAIRHGVTTSAQQ